MREFNAAAAERARRRLGLTYEELTRRVGCSEKTARNLCKGRGEPGASRLAALADALGLELDDLFKGKRREWK